MEDFAFPVTAICAALLGALMVFMTASLALHRRRKLVSYGDGGDGQFAKRLRGQGNAVEQIPISLILLGFAEATQNPVAVIWLIAALMISGRFLHAWQFWNRGGIFFFRPFGVALTLAGQVTAIVAILFALFPVG